MSKEVIYTEKAPKPIGPYSQAIKVGRLVFGSGQISIDPRDGKLKGEDVSEQTRIILTNISEILKEVGYSLGDIVSVTVFLKKLEDYESFNKVYSEFFKENTPARTTVEVSNLPKGALIEINFIAYR